MRKYLLLCSLSTIAWPVLAQAQSVDPVPAGYDPAAEATITVTATGTPMQVSATGQPVTVVAEAEIASVQGADLTRVLERVPGLTMTRNGGTGGFTGVRLRGAEAEQTLVVIDGVRVADPAAPGGGFDFGNLLASNLEKLEILRSSNSTIWGSDAIGGVIVASTRAANGARAEGEYGARGTATAALSGGLASERGFLGASASYFRTDGFSSAAKGTEADGFEQWSVGGHGRLYLSDRFELFARGRYAEGRLDLDGFPAPAFALADTIETQDTRQFAASAGAVFDSGPLFLTGTYSRAETERDNLDPVFGPTFTSTGTSDRLALRGEWRPIGPLLVHFGGEHEWSDYQTLFDAGRSTTIFGAYTQLGVEYGGFSARIGGRIDDHARFGTAASFGGDLSYRLAGDVRVRASVGEGFKAPTLFQLFSDFGNESLRPERSTSFDLGLTLGERTLAERRFYAAGTLFRRDASDQIDFASCFGSTAPICSTRPFGYYDNIGQVRAQGFELELGARPADSLTTRAVYAYIDTENRTAGSSRNGNTLARRPHHALTVSADWQPPLWGITLGADVRMVSGSFENAANTIALEGYEVVTLRAAVPVGDQFELFGRIENLFDSQYETAAGYANAGRGAFVGARLAL